MSTTSSVIGIATRKGPHSLGGALHLLEVSVKVTGTYATAGKPNIDLLAALKAARHQGISAVSVKGALTLQDGDDGSNRWTVPNAGIALSGTGNKVITFQVNKTGTNGDTGTEMDDGTTLNHVFSFAVVTSITGAL